MEPLKNLIDRKVVEAYSNELSKHLKQFDYVQFENLIINNDWEQRELMNRIQHVADVIHITAQGSFGEIVEGLEKAAMSLPSGFEQIIFPTYVKMYGLDYFDRSMQALELLTQFSTGEFAVRPFIKAFPDKTMIQMRQWSSHKNEHIRRLASEGCRPRLPWGGNLKAFIKDPSPVLVVLEELKNDESLYVRKSVANNLNDITKDHPELVLGTCRRWLSEKNERTSWIVKKALRTLLKRPHPEALELFGYGNVNSIEITELKLQDEIINIGDKLKFSFLVNNQGKNASKLRVEYLIYYKKKSGSSTKVFQISEFELEGNENKEFSKTQAFHHMTTRKLYPGKHKLSIRVNGIVKVEKIFELK